MKFVHKKYYYLEVASHAAVYWYFENRILKVPEKTSKSEVKLSHGHVRNQFRDHVLTNFLCKVYKNVTVPDYRVSGLWMTIK